jgi:hypothetical protein
MHEVEHALLPDEDIKLTAEIKPQSNAHNEKTNARALGSSAPLGACASGR